MLYLYSDASYSTAKKPSYSIHNSQLSVSILSQMNEIHVITDCFF